ncbi:lipoate--protein ligase [Halothermothrix orenii]|uniref:lipoate--protein ligase n=1 Tax=Halothermothrix orenii (strain H 168 / OCM 544 / DSM 9562) TaxID=373903 RepID=B8D239_HALOH|nr:lipoate--protein ligase [Halothermothrix orenii]ACL69266.1 lipoate-protein ligase [Halothermothrix orenii H 168]
MEFKPEIIYSQSFNPWYNLALEEYLLNGVSDNEVILYLWQNDNTVVVGRNQNAWKECRCKLLEEEGGKLARRLSGGGAVYHDLGNLNFTFLMKDSLYDLKHQLNVILNAVKMAGIEAEFSGRNDLVVQGKKFSGNAFYKAKGSSYHHGTILVNSDFSKLMRYLQVSSDKIRSKGVDSVRARVINLKEVNPDINIEKMKKLMEESFIKAYGDNIETSPEEINPEKLPELDKLYQKYSSWEWRYGRTPEFDIKLVNRFDWGGIELNLALKNGVITESTIYSDAMESDLIRKIASSLKGVPFRFGDINNRLTGLKEEEGKNIIDDLLTWLKNKIS